MSLFSVSVVVPAYNASSTLVRALDSVRAQTLQPIEVIVVDDGSTDGTLDVVSDYLRQHGLTTWRVLSQVNGGPSRARDAAIRVARGGYIALLDADDAWMPEKIEVSTEMIRLYELDIIGSAMNANAELLGCKLVHPVAMLFRNPFFTSTVIFLKTAYIDVGGFELNQKYSEDFRLWLTFAWCDMRCGQMSRTLAYYRAGVDGPHLGLSSKTLKMQVFEVMNFVSLTRNRLVPFHFCAMAVSFSCVKFLFRFLRLRSLF